MTRHAICVQARHEPCHWCHAPCEQPCAADRPGVHVCRMCLAADEGLITMLDKATELHRLGPCYGWSLVLDVAS